jgi:type VI secretion system protein ImpF
MQQRNTKPPPRLSVLDRLLLGDSTEFDRSGQRESRALREAVRRDLELLFNTRPRCLSWPSELSELPTSLISYGLPDLQSRPVATASQREAFRANLEAIIQRFEPRFRELSVEILENQNPLDRTLRFRIHAVLMADADSEPVVYDTLFDPASRGLSVSTQEF